MGPSYIQCSTSINIITRLGLNLFRGEPAISEFDWNFSAILKSSPPFSQKWVRSSIVFYHYFNLLKDRSLGFGSITAY